MLSTKQVRDIMHKHGNTPIWTNKRAGNDDLRGVKCYHYGDNSSDRLVNELQTKAGTHNVRVTDGPTEEESLQSRSIGLGGIVVTCVLR